MWLQYWLRQGICFFSSDFKHWTDRVTVFACLQNPPLKKVRLKDAQRRTFSFDPDSSKTDWRVCSAILIPVRKSLAFLTCIERAFRQWLNITGSASPFRVTHNLHLWNSGRWSLATHWDCWTDKKTGSGSCAFHLILQKYNFTWASSSSALYVQNRHRLFRFEPL